MFAGVGIYTTLIHKTPKYCVTTIIGGIISTLYSLNDKWNLLGGILSAVK